MITRSYVLPLNDPNIERIVEGCLGFSVLDPAGLRRRRRRRAHPILTKAEAARRLALFRGRQPFLRRRMVMPVSDRHAEAMFHGLTQGGHYGLGDYVLPVHSPESVATLGQLGFKLRIPRKWRKRIIIAAAVGTAAYFGGGAIAAKMGSKAALKKGAMVAGKAAVKHAAKKRKKAAKTLLRAVKTVAQSEGLMPTPGSIAETQGGGGGGGFPGGGGGGMFPEEFTSEEAPGVQKAGFAGGGVLGLLVVGGLLVAAMAGGGRGGRKGRR